MLPRLTLKPSSGVGWQEQRKTDLELGAVATELTKYKLDLVGVQKVHTKAFMHNLYKIC